MLRTDATCHPLTGIQLGVRGLPSVPLPAGWPGVGLPAVSLASPRRPDASGAVRVWTASKPGSLSAPVGVALHAPRQLSPRVALSDAWGARGAAVRAATPPGLPGWCALVQCEDGAVRQRATPRGGVQSTPWSRSADSGSIRCAAASRSSTPQRLIAETLNSRSGGVCAGLATVSGRTASPCLAMRIRPAGEYVRGLSPERVQSYSAGQPSAGLTRLLERDPKWEEVRARARETLAKGSKLISRVAEDEWLPARGLAALPKSVEMDGRLLQGAEVSSRVLGPEEFLSVLTGKCKELERCLAERGKERQ